ncbi:hypothetical protein HXX76_002865 [Chlamydomonas incerta]|uniref:TRP C-terminal domain-containing protein n=1 Tax=Chlamydomonas incerta TaxID=51695 RepID=A0A835TPD9_CHLIN|nr:hypothetical protein HXX76_002865 [Chlamydomonas incerta]|eukprot:KAG2442785.1 hypothetical protein HXX76_002865 [Chlamydomonas incerta]
MQGGAIYTRGAVSRLGISNGARLQDNSAGSNGGAISSILLGNLLLRNNATVSGNRAGGDGGGVFCDRLTALEMSGNSTAVGNTAGRSGGLLSVVTLPDNITIAGGSQLLRNTALRGAGGVISIEVPEPGSALLSQVAPAGSAVLVVSGGVRLANNSAYTDGGCISLAAAVSPTPTDDLSNQPMYSYSLLFDDIEAAGNFAGGAGGLLIVSSPVSGALDTRIALRSSRLSNNSAGSTLYRLGTSVASGYGGALAVSSVPKYRADFVMLEALAAGVTAAADAAETAGLDSACALEITGVAFEDNSCQGLGGGIAAVSCPTIVRNCSFIRNTAALGGGAIANLLEASSDTSDSSVQQGRRRRSRRLQQQQQRRRQQLGSPQDGEQLRPGVWLDVSSSQFISNAAQLDCGGGLYTEVVRGAGTRLVDSQADGNVAQDQNGGGVCIVAKSSGASAVLERVVLRGNRASRLGGAVFASMGAGSSSVTVTQSVLTSNAAVQGGAAAVQAGAGASLRVTDSVLQTNIASLNGGALFSACDPGSAVACGSATPAADADDATAAAAAVLSVSGCTLVRNAARSGRGGALYVSTAATAAVLNSSITGGWAGDSGGGVAAVGCAMLVIGSGSSLSNSSALRFGGGLFAYSCARVRLQDSVVAHNRAATGAGVFVAGPSSSSSLLESLVAVQPDAAALGTSQATIMVVVQRTTMTDNAANGTAAAEQVVLLQGSTAGGAQQPQLAVADQQQQQQQQQAIAAQLAAVNGYKRFSAHGGAVFVHGDVAVALQDVDMSLGNTALAGAAVGSTQQSVMVTDADGHQLQLYHRSASNTNNSTEPLTLQRLQLRPGSTFMMSVRLYNAFGQPTRTDTLAWRVTASLEPANPTTTNETSLRGLGTHLRSQPQLPWQDAAVANLDPGIASGSSLTADVNGGVATWPMLTARGWTGGYVLVFDATSPEDAGLYQVDQLRLPLELLPCAAGEELNLEWARSPGSKPSWVACAACSRGGFTLWRDTRPSLGDAALAGADYYSRMKSISEMMAGAEASCLPCPAHATCPGGAVVVPEPGYWHSAPDSARVHRCPQQPACGDPCAEGYTGNLCAACQPGYYGNAEFECSECPSTARTVSLAVLSFLGSVALVIYTAFTNLKENHAADDEAAEPADDVNLAEPEEGMAPSEVLKLLIVHIQYYIIITRLPISYPDSITRTAAVVTALTGAESKIAFSPSCLFVDDDSTGQAHTQLLAALVIPCIVVATLRLSEQLGIVLMCAVFILYPGWANATLSIFSCYRIDDGTSGPFPDRQQATWYLGYWTRNMEQQCYSGTHMALYLPIGIAAFMLFCVAPPLTSFLLLWWRRRNLDSMHIRRRFGFLYDRYKPRYFYWESVLMLQELALVAVEVFGRSLALVSYQVLIMQAAFMVLALVNMACSPVKSRQSTLLEFVSFSVLALTLTLSMYFVVGNDLQDASANAIGFIIMAINLALLVTYIVLLLRKSWSAAQKKLAVPLRVFMQRVRSHCRHRQQKDLEVLTEQGQLDQQQQKRQPEAMGAPPAQGARTASTSESCADHNRVVVALDQQE